MLKVFSGMFRQPDNLAIAQRDLFEARCKLLEAEEAESYAKFTCMHHRATIARLEALLRKGNNVTEPPKEVEP